MNKEKALERIAAEIEACPFCKKGGTGRAVPGEGNPDAQIVLVGEAPGTEEAKVGRPFVGRSGKFLRTMLKNIGLEGRDIFITSPVHYLPVHGTPSKKAVLHGREHLLKQLSVIGPSIIVLLGSTACLALLDRKVEISREHGSVIDKNGQALFITFHPAYAMRFPEGKGKFIRDFRKLKTLIQERRQGFGKGREIQDAKNPTR